VVSCDPTGARVFTLFTFYVSLLIFLVFSVEEYICQKRAKFLVDPDPKAKHNNLLESLDDDQYVCRISRAYTKYAKISLPVGKLQVPKHFINLTSVANLTQHTAIIASNKA